ncbi:MAG: ribose-phosphate pyrophosphokinase [Lachnospiraceae bacterium]|nr:ribose-phosphate pyrophosphokinase [Lachnospiraceae bacterium]
MADTNRDFAFNLPVGPLKILALESCKTLAQEVDSYIRDFRLEDQMNAIASSHDALNFVDYREEGYLMNSKCIRFGTGESKGVLYESARGSDVYILCDITNYSLTYSVCGHLNHMSPDDHFQDMKRMIATCIGAAKRVTVIMPFLYESRQHKRSRRESLDCAFALEELVNMGVNNIITFDAHDPRVQNAIPLHGFDNFTPPYQFIKALLAKEKNLKIDKDHLCIVSPDEGAMDRSIYFAANLGVDMGMFYKRRDFSKIVGGRNPIVAHEFLGQNVAGKTVIVVDDIISSGESMLDTARELKERGASRVIICCTFGLFTNGYDAFDQFYQEGIFDYVITTNLNYRPDELLNKPWYLEANMSKFLATIIDYLNHDVSISEIMDPTTRIQAIVNKYNDEQPKDLFEEPKAEEPQKEETAEVEAESET